MATQWDTAGTTGVRTGLRYGDCLQVLGLHLPRWQAVDRELATAGGEPAALLDLELADLMGDVQIIEQAILQADHERRERERERGDA